MSKLINLCSKPGWLSCVHMTPFLGFALLLQWLHSSLFCLSSWSLNGESHNSGLWPLIYLPHSLCRWSQMLPWFNCLLLTESSLSAYLSMLNLEPEPQPSIPNFLLKIPLGVSNLTHPILILVSSPNLPLVLVKSQCTQMLRLNVQLHFISLCL
jgi:hypothetical protein